MFQSLVPGIFSTILAASPRGRYFANPERAVFPRDIVQAFALAPARIHWCSRNCGCSIWPL